MNDKDVRDHVSRLLAWQDAHAGFDKAIKDTPVDLRGRRPNGLPHSPWELLEHIRLAQYDILDFCRNPHYKELTWPADYWPPSPAPPTAGAWDASLQQFFDDRRALQQLAADQSIDLTSRIPHGNGQTYLRELLLAADHTAYHVGQLVLVRQLLGAWLT
jgi:DinB family protein